MPNWLENFFTVKHSDPAMIDRFFRAFEGGSLLEEFVPPPSEVATNLKSWVHDRLSSRMENC